LADPLSPRYLAEHVLLPGLVGSGVGSVLRSISLGDDYPIAAELERAGLGDQRLHLRYAEVNGVQVGVFTLPPPVDVQDGYMAAFIGRVSDPTYGRYIVCELGDGGKPIIGEWAAGNRRTLGDAPAVTGDVDVDLERWLRAVLGLETVVADDDKPATIHDRAVPSRPSTPGVVSGVLDETPRAPKTIKPPPAPPRPPPPGMVLVPIDGLAVRVARRRRSSILIYRDGRAEMWDLSDDFVHGVRGMQATPGPDAALGVRRLAEAAIPAWHGGDPRIDDPSDEVDVEIVDGDRREGRRFTWGRASLGAEPKTPTTSPETDAAVYRLVQTIQSWFPNW
jgi:hypothetical protein